MTEMTNGSDHETGSTSEGWVPPYVAFTTLINLINRMAQQGGAPAHIDRRWIGGSGTNQSQMVSALKALGLREDDGSPCGPLHELVNKPEERPRLVRELLERYYPEPVRLGTQNGTQAQLLTWFKERGLSTETARKAAAFFLQAAEFAQVPTSPYFSKTRSGPAKPRPANRRSSKPAKGAIRAESRNGDSSPPEGSNARPSLDELKIRYLEGLLRRAEAEDADDSLRDRIERLLGFQQAGKSDQ